MLCLEKRFFVQRPFVSHSTLKVVIDFHRRVTRRAKSWQEALALALLSFLLHNHLSFSVQALTAFASSSMATKSLSGPTMRGLRQGAEDFGARGRKCLIAQAFHLASLLEQKLRMATATDSGMSLKNMNSSHVHDPLQRLLRLLGQSLFPYHPRSSRLSSPAVYSSTNMPVSEGRAEV